MKNIKLRLYVKENKEVYEIVNTNGFDLYERYTYPLGSTFIDFIDANLDNFNEDMTSTYKLLKEVRNKDYPRYQSEHLSEEEQKKLILNHRKENDVSNKIKKIYNLSNSIKEHHIYFNIYDKYINDVIGEYIDCGAISSKWKFINNEIYEIKSFINLVNLFIKEYLFVDIDKNISMSERFMDIQQKVEGFWGSGASIVIPQTTYDYYPEKLYNYTNFKNENLQLSQIIYPTSISDIICYLLVQQIQYNTRYNKCKNCGKYFVLTGHKNTEYCDRFIDDTGRTCKDIGAMASYLNKKNEDPIFKAFNKAYKTKHARIRRGKITHEKFDVWCDNARIMRDKCYNNEIDLDYLAGWLQSDSGFTGEFMDPHN